MNSPTSEPIIPGASTRRRPAWAAVLALAELAAGLPRGLAADSPAPEQAAPGAAKAPELFKLKNDELLKQADATSTKVSDDDLAQLRNLATIERSLQDVRAQLDALTAPVEAPAPSLGGPKRPAPDLAAGPARDPNKTNARPATPAPDPGKPAPGLDAIQAIQERATRRWKLVGAHKAELDRLSSGLDACQLATVAFQNALDDLSAYGLEAGLRVKDGSLPAAKVPDSLQPEVIERKKQELVADQAKRKERAAAIHQTEAVVARQLDEANRAVLAGAAEVSLGLKKLALHQKSEELARAMTGRAPADLDLLGQLANLKRSQALLAGRRGPTGLAAESGLYQQEQRELKAKSAANGRRALALTGETLPKANGAAGPEAESPSPPVSGGQIGRTRAELRRLRVREVRVIALKILGILVVASVLPALLAWVFARQQQARGDEGTANMALSALMAFSRTATWVAALVAILTVLGVDVTAIIAGLGIGGLAIGLAAQPMIADIISAIIIFAERRFKIGDVITTGGGEPSRVVGLTWRSSQLNNADGVVVNIPNRNITSTNIQNLTRDGKTYDSINVTVSTTKAVSEIRTVIREAMDECKHLTTDRGESIKEFNHKGESKVIKYRFWWYLRDYEMRNRTRDEVFTRVSENLAAERLAGTEVTLS